MTKKEIYSQSHPETWMNELSSDEQSQIATTTVLTPEEMIAFIQKNKVKHLIQKESSCYKERLGSSIRMVKNPADYFSFPVRTILHANCEVKNDQEDILEFEFQFRSSQQKDELLEKFNEYFKSFNQSEALLSDVNLVIDELFTNAIYNASSNNDENTSEGHARDGLEHKLKDGHFGRVFAARDKTCLLIGCEDPYGTLNIAKMIERIHSCLLLGPDRVMRFGEGGAGIGCYLIYMNSMSFYVGVEKNLRTQICSLIPLGVGDRKRYEMQKDFHSVEI